jgi:hypothetical protein
MGQEPLYIKDSPVRQWPVSLGKIGVDSGVGLVYTTRQGAVQPSEGTSKPLIF